ncbi:MAG TPA: hypothetical protein DEF42_10205 [Desulfosporosinus sp.]|nr:hypothetical protein [Desulfosporosinus sp.]
MNMIEKIEMMMKERDLNKSDVAKGAGIPYTTLDGLFKKGFENVRFPTLKKLAQFFDVSMEYLSNENEDNRDFGKVFINEFDADEQRLISLWRKLSRDEQMKLIGRIEAKLEDDKE